LASASSTANSTSTPNVSFRHTLIRRSSMACVGRSICTLPAGEAGAQPQRSSQEAFNFLRDIVPGASISRKMDVLVVHPAGRTSSRAQGLRLRVPDARGVVVGCSRKASPIGRPGDAPHNTGVARQLQNRVNTCSAPVEFFH
jgi:hypothetical protein